MMNIVLMNDDRWRSMVSGDREREWRWLTGNNDDGFDEQSADDEVVFAVGDVVAVDAQPCLGWWPASVTRLP